METKLRWYAKESKSRGLREGEILILSSGSHSDYGVNRALRVCRDVSGSEIERAADIAQISHTPERGPEWDYVHDGSVVAVLIASGALAEIKACEWNTESRFRNERGGIGININTREYD